MANNITVSDGFDARYTGEVYIKAAVPHIYLQTTATSKPMWDLHNNVGRLVITNGNGITYSGSDYGFEVAGKFYINGQLTSTSNLDLFVNGATELLGHVGIGNTPD